MPRKKGFLPKNYKNIFIKNSNDDSRINEMMYSLKLVEKVFNDKEVFENLTKFINGFLSVEGGGGGYWQTNSVQSNHTTLTLLSYNYFEK